MSKKIGSFLLALCCLVASPSAVRAEVSQSVLALQEQVTKGIASAEPSVVAINRAVAFDEDRLGLQGRPLLQSRTSIESQLPYTTGAGVVIDAKGLVLTQYLNVRVGDRHTITTTGGKTYEATIKGADPRSGLAVLSVEGASLTPIEFGDATKLRKGQFVVAIANPIGITEMGQASASMGIVSNIGAKAPREANFGNAADEGGGIAATSLHQLGTLIETDVTLGWSNGGGALVDLDGKLVGVMTDAVKLPGHEAAAHYAIPINAAFRGIIERLKRGEEVEYALLGVTLGDNPALLGNDVDTHATVLGVFQGGPADGAGLLPGDVILSVDSKPIDTAQDLQLEVGLMTPGRTVAVEFVRAGQNRTTDMKLAKYFVAGEQVITANQRSWRGLKVDFATALPLEKLTESSEAGLIDPEGCVLVTAVEENGAAWQSGVRPGMFVSHVGNQRVTTPDEFYTAAQNSNETIDLRFTESRRPAEFERDAQDLRRLQD